MIDFVKSPSRETLRGDTGPVPSAAVNGTGGTKRAAAASSGESAFDYRVLLRSLRRRWFVGLLAGIPVGVVAAIAAWIFVPAPYVAERDLYIKSFDDRLVFETGEARAKFDVRKNTAKRRVTSPEVLTAALRDPQVANSHALAGVADPVEWLSENVKVADSGPEFFTISMTGERPDELAHIVNKITDAFWDEVVLGSKTEQAERLVELDKLLQQTRRELTSLRRQLVELSEKSSTATTVMAEQKQKSLLEELVNLHKSISDVDMQIILAEAGQKYEDGRKVEETEIPDGVVDAYVVQSPEYQELTQKIERQKSLVRRNEQTLTPTHRNIAESKERLAALEQERDNLNQTLRPQVLESIRREATSSIAMSASQRADEIARLKLYKETLISRRDQIHVEEKKSGLLTLEIDELTKKIERKETMATRIEDEIERREFEMRADLYPIEKLQPATVPSKRNMKKRIGATGIGAIGGVGVVLAGIVFLDSLRRRISSVKEVSGELSVRLIGSIPAMPRSAMEAPSHGRRGARAVFWQNALKESVDAARTLILVEAERSDLQVLMIASAVSSEGKTTLTCHLATSLARAGHRVVILDCDLRRPSIDQVFGLEAAAGVSELLREEIELDAALSPAGPPGLFVITAGQADSTAHERILSGGLASVLATLRETFDFILVDTPPVLPVCDALVIAQDVDATMFSVRRDVSQLEKVAAALNRFSSIGVSVLGAVTIGLDDDPVGYGGYFRDRDRYGYRPGYLQVSR